MKFNLLRVSLLSAAIALCGTVAVKAMLGTESQSVPVVSADEPQAKELLNLNNAPAVATFAFNLGTDGQKATFDHADYFLDSKVTYGSNLVLDGKDNKSLNQTWFNPQTKQTAASSTNEVKFFIQPKHGLVFTPTKISFKATRFGTSGGSLDIVWINPDGSTVSLAKAQKPVRDNENPNVSTFSYDVTGAKGAEGRCGIGVNIYSLDPGKHVGISDVVIEGTVSGQEKEVPILGSFSALGVNYVAADVFEPNGNDYVTTIELASTQPMISESNPVTDIVALGGTVGTVTYAGDADKCDVTIPVTLADVTINYIVHFVRKPFYTLTYYNTDGTVMGTQQVEKDAAIGQYAVDYTTAKADEGYKVRGWFESPVVGKKILASDVITKPVGLYAVATEIETESNSRKYEYDMTSATFYPEDHEAFNVTGGYYHDNKHGWAFKNGDKIELLVGPKATIMVGLCQYGAGKNISVTDAAGTVLGTMAAKSETDGDVVAYNYEGTGGKIVLNLESDGEMYLHNLKIVNTTEPSYTVDGQWIYVKAGDVHSLLDAIDAAGAQNSSASAERIYIYVPNGTYDLRERVLTRIYGNNISIIGQSMNGVIIRNEPHKSIEGISTTATLYNLSKNLYVQDVTIKNDLDYYGTIAGHQPGGRAVAFWDKGTNTICKNVTLLSYQDTYYSNNIDGKYYWETSDVHGTVDFLCGEGTMFMENCTLTVEKRNANGKGECTILAASTKAGNRYGYVFNNCRIENRAERYNFGRAWSNEPRAAYLNTTLNDNKLNSSRWTAGGMNVAAKEYVEYNTMDANGKVVSPASHVVNFNKGNVSNKMETILTAEQAAEFAVDKVFPDWKPQALAAQVAAPVSKMADGNITWDAVEGAAGYAVFKDGELLAITTATSYAPATVDSNAVYSVRSINSMGGLGVEARVGDPAGISDVETSATVVKTVCYNTQGVIVDSDYVGVVIKAMTYSDGHVEVEKVVNR